MRSAAVLASLTLALPFFALATTTGFPEKSVWLSNDAPQAGEQVRIFTVVYNGGADELQAKVSFLIDGETLEAQELSLAAGATRVLSAQWKAQSGPHTFAARFNYGSTTQASADTTISVPSPPSPAEEALNSAQETVAQALASTTPVVQSAVAKVAAVTEAVRQAGIDYLESKLDSPHNTLSTATSSPVEGFEAPSSTVASTSSSLLHNATQLAAAAALFTFKTAWLFYLLIVVGLFILFRFLKNWVNKPRF